MLCLQRPESADEVAELTVCLRLMAALIVGIDPFGDSIERGADDGEVLIPQFGEEGICSGQQDFPPLLLCREGGESCRGRGMGVGLWIDDGRIDLDVSCASFVIMHQAQAMRKRTVLYADELVN